MNIPLILDALRIAEGFVASELEVRSTSFLPGPNEDEVGYLGSAQTTLDVIRAAITEASGERPQSADAKLSGLVANR